MKHLNVKDYGLGVGDWLHVSYGPAAREAFGNNGRRFNIAHAMDAGFLKEENGLTVLVETRPLNVRDERFVGHPFALRDMDSVKVLTGGDVRDCTGMDTLEVSGHA